MPRTQNAKNKYSVSAKRRDELDALFRVNKTKTPILNLIDWEAKSFKYEVRVVCTKEFLNKWSESGSIVLGEGFANNDFSAIKGGIYDTKLQLDSKDATRALIDHLCSMRNTVSFLKELVTCRNRVESVIEHLRNDEAHWDFYLSTDGVRKDAGIPFEKIVFKDGHAIRYWSEALKMRQRTYLAIWKHLGKLLDELFWIIGLNQSKVGLFEPLNKSKELLAFLLEGEEKGLFKVRQGTNVEQAYRNLCILFGLGPNTYIQFRSEK